MSGDSCGTMAEMPRYQCHKQVWALQIASVYDPEPPKEDEESPGPGKMVKFIEQDYAPMFAERALFSRYTPKPGDYLVVYDDGYKSFSPKKVFEQGYSRI